MRRQTRSQTRKQQLEQEEKGQAQFQQQPQQLLDSDVATGSDPKQPQPPKPSILSIFLNDFTDADNEASALLWAWSLELRPDIKGIYIAEPRIVNVGYYMNANDFGRCIGLVAKLTPPASKEYTPLRVVLSGSVLTDEYINQPDLKVDGKPITEDERDLVSHLPGTRIDGLATVGTNRRIDITCAAQTLQAAQKWRTAGCDQTRALVCHGLSHHDEGSL